MRNALRSPPGFVEFLDCDCVQPIPRRFEEQASRFSEAPAVRLLSGDISYAELNRAANQTARMLLAKISSETEPIALMLDQGYDSIVWVLAILKAGFCYAPLDQRLPESTLHAIVGNLMPGALITAGRYHGFARSLAGGRFPVILADAPRESFGAENLDRTLSAEALAYVFYTSGSTGAPKGVADCHRNVLHNVKRYTNTLKIAPSDVLSLVQHPRFSGTVSSLFGALVNGAAIAPFDLQAEGLPSISRWLRLSRVTIFHAVPSIFRRLSDPLGKFPDIRLIRLEGDRASARDVDHFRENFHADCTLVNGLGATECGLVRQFFVDHHTVLGNSEPLPIGYPVPDMDVRILAADGAPMPFDVAGEIVVDSRFLANGYWRNPALTVEKFISLPDGRRRYRTGDLGRMSEDGCLTHLGRVDQRIRIAGEFVHTADIENQLLAIPGILQAAVRDFVDHSGEQRLCAYLVADADRALNATRLRDCLAERIARQFVPTAFVLLDALPLTKDLKIDYERLPQPSPQRSLQLDAYTRPRTALERELVDRWEAILKIQPIGVHDNFFDLGGDSISAARLLAEIEKTHALKLPLATIYRAPTVEQLASILMPDAWTGSQSSLWTVFPSTVVPFQPKGAKPPLFWFNWGLWDFRLPRYLDPEQPIYGLQHQSQDGWRADHKNIEQMAANYIEEMRAVRPTGPYLLGGYCIGGMVAFEMAQQLRAQGEEVGLVVLLDPDPLNAHTDSSSRVPRTLSPSSLIEALRQKLDRHLRALALLEPQQKMSYVRERAQNRIALLRGKTSWCWRKFLCEFLNYPLPPDLRSRYLGTIYHTAAAAYVPKPYGGRVVLFKTQGRYRDGELGWGKHLAEKFAVQELEIDHMGVFQEPYVQTFAKILQAHMVEAK